MTTRKFNVTMELELKIELDQEVFDHVDDEWRSVFYASVKEDEDVVEHIAYNLLRGRGLSSLDGWADMKNKQALLFGTEIIDCAIEEVDKES